MLPVHVGAVFVPAQVLCPFIQPPLVRSCVPTIRCRGGRVPAGFPPLYCVGTHTQRNTHTQRSTHTEEHTHKLTHAHMQMNTRTHPDTHTHTHLHVHTRTHTHTRTHARTHIHTRRGTHAHTCVLMQSTIGAYVCACGRVQESHVHVVFPFT